MASQIMVAIGVYALTIVGSLKEWQKTNRKEKAAYVALMLLAAYLAVVFALNKQWPNLDTLLHAVYAWPARAIVRMFKPES